MTKESKTQPAEQSPSLTLPRDKRGRGDDNVSSQPERNSSLSRLTGEGWGEGLSRTIPVPRRRSTERARGLRASQTDAETVFWHAVRAKRFHGYKFRRQFPVGPYFADFVCAEAMLIVEIDGGQHCENNKDQIRTAYLEKEGFTVLRFWNNDILRNIEGVLHTLLKQLESPHDPR